MEAFINEQFRKTKEKIEKEGKLSKTTTKNLVQDFRNVFEQDRGKSIDKHSFVSSENDNTSNIQTYQITYQIWKMSC